jgi:hypothetical protein
MGVLQLIAIFGFLWSLLFLSRFLSSQRWQDGLCLALGTPVTFLTCGYYGLYSLFFLPLAFAFQLRPEQFRLKVVGQLLAIGLISLVLTLPFVWAQHRQLEIYHFSRSPQTIEGNSARLEYYQNVLDHNLLYSKILGLESGQGQRLFPGLGLMGLAGLGLFGRQHPRIKIYLILAVALALLLSLGLRFNVGGIKPYQWIRDYVPGFAQLRSPFRFAMLVQLHLALLAGFGLANLGRWVPSRYKLLSLGAAALAIFEALALPLPLQELPPSREPASWQAWLNEQERDNTGTSHLMIVMLPFAQSSKVEDFEQTTRWMLANRLLRGDMLNGYSGFFPADHGHVRDEMLNFPTPASIQLLRQKGIDYVVVFNGPAKAPSPQALEIYFTRLYRDEGEDVAVYGLK